MIWFFVGAIVALVLIALVYILRRWQVTVHWYEWLLGTAGLALIVFAYQNYYTSRVEFEPLAPGRFLLIFGLPGVLLILIAAILISWNYLRRKQPRRQPAA